MQVFQSLLDTGSRVEVEGRITYLNHLKYKNFDYFWPIITIWNILNGYSGYALGVPFKWGSWGSSPTCLWISQALDSLLKCLRKFISTSQRFLQCLSPYKRNLLYMHENRNKFNKKYTINIFSMENKINLFLFPQKNRKIAFNGNETHRVTTPACNNIVLKLYKIFYIAFLPSKTSTQKQKI